VSSDNLHPVDIAVIMIRSSSLFAVEIANHFANRMSADRVEGEWDLEKSKARLYLQDFGENDRAICMQHDVERAADDDHAFGDIHRVSGVVVAVLAAKEEEGEHQH